MAATITADMKKRFIDDFKLDADSSAVRYYIGISRSEDWNDSDTATTPVNTEREQRDFRHGLQSVKEVTDYSFVIPRVNWTSGTTFAAYSDTVVAHPTVPYYAMIESNQVYVCLRQGTNAAGVTQPSTVAPSGTTTISFTTADGYAWKFLYSIGTLDAAAFKSANFIPVKLQGATTGSSPATDVEQLGIQNAAIAGRQIVGFSIDAAGTGYTSNPTVAITGNGTGAAASAVQSGGSIVKITIDDSASTLKMGTGYEYASIALSGGGGSGATGTVIFGPKAGFGADPTDDLRARAIMFNAKPVGTEEGEFIVGNSFRQIGLIRNPTDSAGDAFTASDGNALRRLAMPTISSAFTQRTIMTGTTSGAKAFVNKTDSDEIWYHQTEATGFTQFQEAEAVTDTSGGAGVTQAAGTDADSDAYIEPKVDKYSGDLMYIENRAAVTRAADQTEDIKVIIEI
ncbi:hypothetical protein N8455_00055 [Candidatus Gracilibacteria bacterium]|nr:hypothetical protein [Candidatus Gracilibacteria bacterium]